MEIVGIDVSQDGNLPTVSKYHLLWTWPDPLTVHDIASLIGFAFLILLHYGPTRWRVREEDSQDYYYYAPLFGTCCPAFQESCQAE